MNSTSIKPLRRSGTSIVATKRLNNTSSFSLAQDPHSAVSAHSSAAKTKGDNQPSPTPTYIEFPTSPQPPDDHTGFHANHNGTIVHHTHSKHPLAEITLSELFTCSGCKEFGAGRRYACQDCDFQLHHFCALSPPSLKAHPFHGQHQLIFHAKPKQGTHVSYTKWYIFWQDICFYKLKCIHMLFSTSSVVCFPISSIFTCSFPKQNQLKLE